MSERDARRDLEWIVAGLESELIDDCRDTPHERPHGPDHWPSVPGYELVARLGQGGMGVVYKARQIKANRTVALKMLLHGSADAESVQRFRRESQTIARFRHPGIVQLYEVDEHESRPFFSMEYCSGGHLGERLKAGLLPARDAAQLVEQLARAAQEAHANGVIHRDLKPSNILFAGVIDSDSRTEPHLGEPVQGTEAFTSAQGAQPKISDFGLARPMDEPGMTHSGVIMGTPAYMAPEQVRGQTTLGPAVDIWALGVIFYECLTGRPPFTGRGTVEVIKQVLETEPVPPSRLNAKVPLDPETICLKCLRKEPHERYASAQDLADDLRCWLYGEPIKARPVGWRERTVKWVRRNPVVAGLVAAVLVVLLSGIIGVSFFAVQANRNAQEASKREADAKEQRKRADRSASAATESAKKASQREQDALNARNDAFAATQRAENARKQAETALRRAETLLLSRNLSMALREWREGNTQQAWALLNACRWDLRSWEHRYLYTLFCSGEETYQAKINTVNNVHFGPDDKSIVFGSQDGTVRMADRDSGQIVRLFQGHTPGNALTVMLGNDGSRLAVATTERIPLVKLWDARDGREIRTLRLQGHSANVLRVAINPGLTHLASVSKDRTVKIWDLNTGRAILAINHPTDRVNDAVYSPDGKKLALASEDRMVRVWNAETGNELLTFNRHGDGVRCLAFSSDGQWLASGGVDRLVKVWSAETGAEICSFPGHTDRLTSLAFSPSGKLLASGSVDGVIKVWDVKVGRLARSLKGQGRFPVNCLTFSHDGKYLASAGSQGKVIVWSVEQPPEDQTIRTGMVSANRAVFSTDGRLLALSGMGRFLVWDAKAQGVVFSRLESNPRVLHAVRVAFSPDGKQLASTGLDGGLRLWEVDRRRLAAFLDHPEACDVAYSPRGKRLASVGSDGTVRLWDLETGQRIFTLRQPTQLRCITYSPSGKRLASGNRDGEITLWDAENGKELRTLKGHAREVSSLSFSADGKQLLSAGGDGIANIWDPETGEVSTSLRIHHDGVNQVIFSSDGTRLVSAGVDATVRLWDVKSGQDVFVLSGHGHQVTSAAFSPNDRELISVDVDGVVKRWHAERSQSVFTLPGVRSLVRAAISRDGKWLAMDANNAAAGLVNLETGEEIRQLKGHRHRVTSLDFSPDGTNLVSGGHDQLVKVWDLATGKEIRSLTGHTKEVTSVCFTPDGKRVASGSSKEVLVWELGTGRLALTIPLQSGILTGMTFSPDGKRLATSHWGEVKIWDTVSGQKRLSLKDPERQLLTAICFTPDGKRLVGALGDWPQASRILVWDSASGHPLDAIASNDRLILGLSCTPTGNRVAAASQDGVVKLWDLESKKSLTLLDQGRAVRKVFVPGDGKRLMTVSEDGQLRSWGLDVLDERLRKPAGP